MPRRPRLFFGASVSAPWPQDYPEGRLLAEEMRHITLVFLGNSDVERVRSLLPSLPKFEGRIAPCGFADGVLFFPQRHPRVVAYSTSWLRKESEFLRFQSELEEALVANDLAQKAKRPFVPHITVARQPFSAHAWTECFEPFPFFVSGVHLYESLGNLTYTSLWEEPFHPPFVEIAHTADIAFNIYGESYEQLHQHAELALAFQFPPLVRFFSSQLQHSLGEIIIALNETIATLDAHIGAPFKAVSFHTALEESNGMLTWEMIVDV